MPGDAADLCDGARAALDQDPRQRRPLHRHQPRLHLGVCQVGVGVRKWELGKTMQMNLSVCNEQSVHKISFPQQPGSRTESELDTQSVTKCLYLYHFSLKIIVKRIH